MITRNTGYSGSKAIHEGIRGSGVTAPLILKLGTNLGGGGEEETNMQKWIKQKEEKKRKVGKEELEQKKMCDSNESNTLTLRRRIKSHLLFAGIIRSSPFSPH